MNYSVTRGQRVACSVENEVALQWAMCKAVTATGPGTIQSFLTPAAVVRYFSTLFSGVRKPGRVLRVL